ncbi:hypothetical protein Glove_482g39 [Diversispora epigaea]|uniref:Protein kinase domain-containing protein n=1 Tax=Diversispora epigaea TaxID=1348612 RepID=A0A397GT01_9GLOM|nr:hypothetical protein Glove_482g39 [Diversispora epigaea]
MWEMKETRKTEKMKKKREKRRNRKNRKSGGRFNLEKCSKCHQDNTGRNWCHPCDAKQFQNEFDKWTSEDREIDKFIQQIQLNANKYQEIIEWIPFDRLENDFVWCRKGEQDVVLKSLDNPTNKNDFLQEIKNQIKFRVKRSIAMYGITKNPIENEYMMVMKYAEYGSLRKLLNNKFEKLSWGKKFYILFTIAEGLKIKPVTENYTENIYGVIPYMAPETLGRGEYTQASDIYSFGMVMLEVLTSYPPCYNVPHSDVTLPQYADLLTDTRRHYITDFGLCKPVTENYTENIYGVIPYMAPETLGRGEYTQASDIYSFGMVMLEVLTSYPPCYNVPHRRDPTTIRRFIDGYKKTVNTENLPHSGWPLALNNNEKNKLANEVTKNRCVPLHEIIDTLSLNCNLTTAKQILYDAGIHFHAAAKKPFVSERHAFACISWCEKYKNNLLSGTSVEIGKQSWQIRVWRGVEERLSIECLEPTFKSGQNQFESNREHLEAIKDKIQNSEAFPRNINELKTALKMNGKIWIALFLKRLLPQC